MRYDGLAFTKGEKQWIFKKRTMTRKISLLGDTYYITANADVCPEMVMTDHGPLFYCVGCDMFHTEKEDTVFHRWMLFFSYPTIKRLRLEDDMKKPDATVNNAVQNFSDERFQKKYPLVAEFLCCTQWDNGDPRQTSSLTIFFEGGFLKMSLNDRACSRSLYVTAASIDTCLVALEEHLTRDIPGWRDWPQKAGKRKG